MMQWIPVVCLSVSTLVAAEPPLDAVVEQRSMLRARTVAAASCAMARPDGRAVPECVGIRAEGSPDYAVGLNSILLPPWETTPFAACFDAASPPSLEMQEIINAARRGMVDRYNATVRWPGTDNAPISLTWSLVPDGAAIPVGAGEPNAGSNLFTRMDGLFGNRALWVNQIQASFDRLAALSGITFTRVSVTGQDWDDGAAWGSPAAAGLRGDIRISMKPIDGASGTLATAQFPTHGDFTFDSSENWQQGAPTYVFLRNVAMHEIIHCLGFDHVCASNPSNLMQPTLITSFDGPQHDDIRGLQRRYADNYEPNNSTSTATVLGGLTAGATLNPSTVPAPAVVSGSLTSIAVNGDIDHYRLTVAAPLLANVTLAPFGAMFRDDSAGGTCLSAPAIDTRAVADLSFGVLNSSASVILAAGDSHEAGLAESANVLLSPPGTHFIRVFENGSPTQSQLYSLTIEGVSTPTLQATDLTHLDRVRCTWSSIPGALAYSVHRGTTTNRGQAMHLGNVGVTSFDDFAAAPGTTYFYWVEVDTGTGGMRPVAGPDAGVRDGAQAPHDTCEGAIDVSAGGTFTGTLISATSGAAASCANSIATPDVWYSFTAGACPGTLTVSTCGSHDAGGVDSNIDTVVSLWSACDGSEVACNDDALGGGCGALDAETPRDSLVSRALNAGENVRIRVGRWPNSTGVDFTLRVAFTAANDTCAVAHPIASGVPTPFCNNGAATDGPGEALCLAFGSDQVNGDVWYRWTAQSDFRFTVEACTATFDTRLAIYRGSCPASAAAIACNDDACGDLGSRSFIMTQGIGGETYFIRVGGFDRFRGTGTLTIYCAADINRSRTVTVQDLFGFLAAYFANDPITDINGSGTVSVQDIFDFLEAYFAGC